MTVQYSWQGYHAALHNTIKSAVRKDSTGIHRSQRSLGWCRQEFRVLFRDSGDYPIYLGENSMPLLPPFIYTELYCTSAKAGRKNKEKYIHF
jgi:hypothetical protein